MNIRAQESEVPTKKHVALAAIAEVTILVSSYVVESLKFVSR